MAVRNGDVIRINGAVVRVLSQFTHDVMCEIVASGNLTSIPKRHITPEYKVITNAPPRMLSRTEARTRRARHTTVKSSRAVSAPMSMSTRSSKSVRHKVVYLLDMGYGHYKVGVSKNVHGRIRQLSTASLSKIRIVGTWSLPYQDALRVEHSVKCYTRARGLNTTGGTEIFRMCNDGAALRAVKACI